MKRLTKTLAAVLLMTTVIFAMGCKPQDDNGMNNLNGNDAPQVAIKGLFSVSRTQQVYFSKGNLQYKASNNTWRFAEHQYDFIGNDNSHVSQNYRGWIDLFGWGTSGRDHGAVCYQPWSTSNTNSDYQAYGQYTNNLNDQTGQADWGYNAISNGGGQIQQWRTLTYDEWEFVLESRTTLSGIRYAKAEVHNKNGVVLLPDNWDGATYHLNNTNQNWASFKSNIISKSQWKTLEEAGAVFLPAAGHRNGNTVELVGMEGGYWSSTCCDEIAAYGLYVAYEGIGASAGFGRFAGFSVRLVCAAPI